MQGTVAGTPVTTRDCQYVLATHNVDDEKGYFSVFSFATATTPVLFYEHPVIDSEAFGAIGYYWSPAQGLFPGEEFNANDVFIWSFDTNLKKDHKAAGSFQFFGFQLPKDHTSPLTVTLIDSDRDFHAKTAPVLTDEGRSMYWSVSRSKVFGWIGNGDFKANGVKSFAFKQDKMLFSASASTTPSLSRSFVVGTSAAAEIWVWNRNFTDVPLVVPTAAVVTTRLLVSPDDMFVYFATPAPDSTLYQVFSASLTESWKVSLPDGIVGDIAGLSVVVVVVVVEVE